MDDKQPGRKQTWIIILFAMTLSALIYLLLAYLMEQGSRPPRDPSGFKLPMQVAAVLALVAASAWIVISTQGKMGGDGRAMTLTADKFQSNSLTAMALSEACSIFGLFYFLNGAHLPDFVPFVVGTVGVNLLVILPKGLTFWTNWERENRT